MGNICKWCGTRIQGYCNNMSGYCSNDIGMCNPCAESWYREEKARRIEQGSEDMTEYLPQTNRLCEILSFARKEAKSLQHNYIAAEHVLLAMLYERENRAAQVLEDWGITYEMLKEDFRKLALEDWKERQKYKSEARFKLQKITVGGVQYRLVPENVGQKTDTVKRVEYKIEE